MSIFPSSFHLGHPSSEALNDFVDASVSPAQAKVASHLATCTECRETVQQFRRARASFDYVDFGNSAALPDATRAALKERMLASRTAGRRTILPVNDVVPAPSRRWIPFTAAAALIVVAVLAEGVLSPSQEIGAGATSGSLVISPALPKPGQTLSLVYTAPASLSGSSSLVVRARLRTVNSDAYEPGAFVRTLGTAVRGKDGNYRASVTLPDSVVFAAIVLQDSTGAVIDDHDKRTWEVLVSLDGKQPAFAALNQRADDMMGRSFEEGQASARRMVQLYPDSIGGWSYLHSFENWMGVGSEETTLVKHRAALKRLDAKWRTQANVPPAMLGMLSWYSMSVDTAVASYWKTRLMSEGRGDSFGLMWRMNDALALVYTKRDTSTALAIFDTLWTQRTPDRQSQIAGRALDLAVSSGRADQVSRWLPRLMATSNDTVAASLAFADQLSRVPTFRAQGMDRLRAMLRVLQTPDPSLRRLTETPMRQDARYEQMRIRALAALGRALVASGDTKAGVDTLTLASKTGWDVSVMRTIRTASFAAGDSATGWEMTARIVAEPTTDPAERATINASAIKAIGAERWSALTTEGVHQFAKRMLENSKMQSLAGTPRVKDSDGVEHTLRSLGGNKVTVVAFWSRHCGWALEDIQPLMSVAKRLEAAGAQLIVVMEDEANPSADLTAFLADRKMTVPVYFDVAHSTSKAFNNWGTPIYYVLDGGGRVRFSGVNSAMSAMVRAEAVRLAP